MRVLNEAELVHVTGAGGSSYYCGCYCPSPSQPSKGGKGNNGFGNGGDANRNAPGNSGSTPGSKQGSSVR